ncbi:WecB/TagA/CpsF family glycosyltransferase [Demequina sp.]|uniref:WecB/TagA/CpsF family glycosyltransferase n=1 Tax=Demequina sp. TaxID=2050685 RepID=UPI003D0F98F8
MTPDPPEPPDIAYVGGVRIAVADATEATNYLVGVASADNSGPYAVCFANAWTIRCANRDREYARLLNEPQTVTFADGRPVAILAKRHARAREHGAQARGPSVFRNVVDRGRDVGLRHFLLGTTEQTLLQLVAALESEYPGAVIAGTWAPPFGPLEGELLDEADRRVRSAHPDIVWIGMGAPRQDFAAEALASRSGVLTAGVGAAFDFVSGVVREAPPLWSRLGLEWLYRLGTDPRRLWRRYIVGNAQFIAYAIRAGSGPGS